MKLRKLNGNDIFKMSKILKKINLNLKDINIDQIQSKEKNVTEIQMIAGAEMLKVVLENLHLAQEEVNDFLGGLCGCSGEDFGEKELDEIAEIIVEFKNMVKGSNFFQHVSKLM